MLTCFFLLSSPGPFIKTSHVTSLLCAILQMLNLLLCLIFQRPSFLVPNFSRANIHKIPVARFSRAKSYPWFCCYITVDNPGVIIVVAAAVPLLLLLFHAPVPVLLLLFHCYCCYSIVTAAVPLLLLLFLCCCSCSVLLLLLLFQCCYSCIAIPVLL